MPEVTFIDATGWSELKWFNSGGTRAKRILQDDDGNIWFFKCSERKEAKDDKPEKYYKYEFWSEIIAYQVGSALGLNVLRYEPSVYEGQIGCISPIMIDQNSQQLSEIGRYMTATDIRFVPSNTKARKLYSFQLLRTFKRNKFSRFWQQIFQTLLFDVIIGNTDRHQENWAIIINPKAIDSFFQKHKIGPRRWKRGVPCLLRRKIRQRKIFEALFAKVSKKVRRHLHQMGLKIFEKMAPIYDNGSSLGRELTDAKVDELVNDDDKLMKYINGGSCELHWNGEKLSHFNFIKKLLESSYIKKVKHAGKFLSGWSDSRTMAIMSDVDVTLPQNLSHYKIPENRKKLIIKLLTLRAQKLNELLHG
jgi:hypothetical protein